MRTMEWKKAGEGSVNWWKGAGSFVESSQRRRKWHLSGSQKKVNMNELKYGIIFLLFVVYFKVFSYLTCDFFFHSK